MPREYLLIQTGNDDLIASGDSLEEVYEKLGLQVGEIERDAEEVLGNAD